MSNSFSQKHLHLLLTGLIFTAVIISGYLWFEPKGLWLELSMIMVLIYGITALIPFVFHHPVWPYLYRSTLRLLASGTCFLVYYFYILPGNSQPALMILIYYFLFIFTDIFFRLLNHTNTQSNEK